MYKSQLCIFHALLQNHLQLYGLIRLGHNYAHAATARLPWHLHSCILFELSDYVKITAHMKVTDKSKSITGWIKCWWVIKHECVDKYKHNSLRPSDAYMRRLHYHHYSDNSLSPGRRQAIIWTNAGILLIGPLGANYNGIIIKIHTFSLKKILFIMSYEKWRPFYPGCNVLITNSIIFFLEMP